MSAAREGLAKLIEAGDVIRAAFVRRARAGESSPFEGSGAKSYVLCLSGDRISAPLERLRTVLAHINDWTEVSAGA